MNIQPFYAGTSGLVLPVANKSLFPELYKDKSRLTYYGSLYNTIEINSSFKKIPMARTVLKWAAEVPENFQFTFKCWRGITHNKDLLFNRSDVADFFRVINHVGKKKGCLLIQFPGKLTIDHRPQLEKLLESIQSVDSDNQWKLALEFRNPSWYQGDIFDFLRANQAALVLHDLPGSAPPMIVTGNFTYLRFHGTEKGYRGSYTDGFLQTQAGYVRAWNQENRDVYVYFNNTLGNAAQNLTTLKRFVEAR